MAVPKKRTSSTKQGMRRSHHKLVTASLTRCPKCQSLTPMHQACPTCGTYRGRTVIEGV